MAKATRKADRPADRDDLVRETAGRYHSGDARFEIQKSDMGWFLVDTEQANEFGQQLIHGPFATLDAVRDAMPGARELKPLLRVRPKRASRPAANEPPAPPPSWIDELPADEAKAVRRLIRTLEKEGLTDAEELVKRHRDDPTPEISKRILENRLEQLIGRDTRDQAETRALVRSVVEVLADEGASLDRPLPGWTLVEVDDDRQPTKRRVRPRV